jgi:hypothetical protein
MNSDPIWIQIYSPALNYAAIIDEWPASFLILEIKCDHQKGLPMCGGFID